MFSIIIMLTFAPFIIMAAHYEKLRRSPPRELWLAKASHGAMLLFMAALAAWLQGTAADRAWLHVLTRDPLDLDRSWPALIWTGGMLWGGFWLLIYGRLALSGGRDAALTLRALAKVALGVVIGLYLLPRMPGSRQEALLNPLMVIPAWLLVTGTVRLLLLVIGGGGNALRAATRQLRQQNAPLRPVRPRRFVLF
jgi:hypothetical protein